jgi:TP901 family phage tail tape measure protein
MTGQHTNIRELGQVTRAFGLDVNQSSEALDMLKVASEHTLAPVDELFGALKSMGPTARSLHLDLGQTAAVIDMFEQAGLDATTTTKGLNKAVAEAAKHHIDLHTMLQRTIEEPSASLLRVKKRRLSTSRKA